MQTEFSLLKKRVKDVARQSAMGTRVRDLVVESDRDEDGTEFLRIILMVEPLDDIADDDAQTLVDSIEAAVADLDERFPSVRFADAA